MDIQESRSILKSKRSLQNAVVSLLLEKPLQKITIKEVCEQAELSRSSFYAHYKDILDLVDQMENNALMLFEQMCINMKNLPFPENIEQYLSAFFALIDNNQQLAKMFILLHENSRFYSRLNHLLKNAFLDTFDVIDKHIDQGKYEYYSTFLSDGTTGILRAWVIAENKLSANEMMKIVYDMYYRILSR